MKLLEKKIGPAAVVAGAAVIACVPCCITLIAPALAWLGVSTLGAAATGWYAGMAAAFAVGLAAFLFIRHRAAARRAASAQCGCQGACQVDFSSIPSGDNREHYI